MGVGFDYGANDLFSSAAGHQAKPLDIAESQLLQNLPSAALVRADPFEDAL